MGYQRKQIYLAITEYLHFYKHQLMIIRYVILCWSLLIDPGLPLIYVSGNSCNTPCSDDF